MKSKLLTLALTPNLWVAIFCALAGVALVCLALGATETGLWLLAPLLVMGILLALVLIPLLIRRNRKYSARSKDQDPTVM